VDVYNGMSISCGVNPGGVKGCGVKVPPQRYYRDPGPRGPGTQGPGTLGLLVRPLERQ
jgi:hypothetical protein